VGGTNAVYPSPWMSLTLGIRQQAGSYTWRFSAMPVGKLDSRAI
jgi:hypothetical protein